MPQALCCKALSGAKAFENKNALFASRSESKETDEKTASSTNALIANVSSREVNGWILQRSRSVEVVKRESAALYLAAVQKLRRIGQNWRLSSAFFDREIIRYKPYFIHLEPPQNYRRADGLDQAALSNPSFWR